MEITQQQLIEILAALEIATATIEDFAGEMAPELAEIEGARQLVIELLFGRLN